MLDATLRWESLARAGSTPDGGWPRCSTPGTPLVLDARQPAPHPEGKPAMTTTIPSVHTVTVTTDDVGAVDLQVTERGQGRAILLLHGGAGPTSVFGYADHLAATRPVRVITPTHPGFDGTVRPDALTTIRQLAQVYAALLEELDLRQVTVVGNSIGGWIAAELALTGSPRIADLVLVDAVGIEVSGHPVVDFFSLTFPQVLELSYHDPDAFRVDPAALPAGAQAAMAANRATLAAYAGEPSMTDLGLRARLAGITVPALVIWGASDRIVDPGYGRAYAVAIPGARFELISNSGHLPQLETPDALTDLLWDFTTAHSCGAGS